MTAVSMLRLLCSSPRLLQASDSTSAEALIEAGLVPDEDGPKMEWLRERAGEWQLAGDRAVIFTFSKRMADLICERFTADGIRHVSYTGSTNDKDRETAVEAFTTAATVDDPGPTCFVATDAAAEGLNLGRCCSLLVNVDVPWQPAVLEQRSNRIHRVDGTHSSYLVVNLTVAGTMEEGLVRMISRKVDLADTLLGERGGRERTVGRRRRGLRTEEFLAEALDEHFGSVGDE
jgi:SNF2 family DNA or RNA helicase